MKQTGVGASRAEGRRQDAGWDEWGSSRSSWEMEAVGAGPCDGGKVCWFLLVRADYIEPELLLLVLPRGH